jgi:hypothetical protein
VKRGRDPCPSRRQGDLPGLTHLARFWSQCRAFLTSNFASPNPTDDKVTGVGSRAAIAASARCAVYYRYLEKWGAAPCFIPPHDTVHEPMREGRSVNSASCQRGAVGSLVREPSELPDTPSTEGAFAPLDPRAGLGDFASPPAPNHGRTCAVRSLATWAKDQTFHSLYAITAA